MGLGTGDTKTLTNAALGGVCPPFTGLTGAGKEVPGGNGEARCRQAAEMVSRIKMQLAHVMRLVE